MLVNPIFPSKYTTLRRTRTSGKLTRRQPQLIENCRYQGRFLRLILDASGWRIPVAQVVKERKAGVQKEMQSSSNRF